MRDSSNFDDPKGINEKRGGFFDDKVSPVGNPQSCLCGKSNSAVSGNVISIVCSYVYLYKVYPLLHPRWSDHKFQLPNRIYTPPSIRFYATNLRSTLSFSLCLSSLIGCLPLILPIHRIPVHNVHLGERLRHPFLPRFPTFFFFI